MSRFPTLQLRRVFRVVNGGTPTSDVQNWDGDVPWATPVDLGAAHGAVLSATGRTLTSLGLRTGSSAVPAGSLIVSTRAPSGYVAQASQDTAFNQGCRGLVPKDSLDVRYHRYQLLALADELQSRGQGSTFIELSSDSLASVQMASPPVGEQRSIADYLDAETARIDALIAKKRRMIALLEERTLSIIAASAPTDGATVRLGSIARIQTGLTLGAGRGLGGSLVTLPYLRVANVQDGSLDLDELKEVSVPHAVVGTCSLRPGDVLMTEGGDPDKLGRGTVWPGIVEPCLHQNHVFAVRPNSHVLLPEFLALLTRMPYARSYFEKTAAKTTGIASTSTAKIASFRVPLPDTRDQQRVVAATDRRLDVINATTGAVIRQIGRLRERRQALITAAVTGDLDIPGTAA